jgi:DNA excision repair protein ERCC-4
MTYPNLRLVWSCSPETTVALFREIKRGKPEPSADEAVSRGQQSGVDSDDGGESIDQATRYRDNRNHQAIDLLKKLPGITSDNAEKIIAEISSLAELAVTSTEKLESLLGKEKGKVLYAFLHAKRSVEAPVAKKGRAQT